MTDTKTIARHIELDIIIKLILVMIAAVLVTTLGLGLSSRTQDAIAGTIGVLI